MGETVLTREEQVTLYSLVCTSASSLIGQYLKLFLRLTKLFLQHWTTDYSPLLSIPWEKQNEV